MSKFAMADPWLSLNFISIIAACHLIIPVPTIFPHPITVIYCACELIFCIQSLGSIFSFLGLSVMLSILSSKTASLPLT